MLDAARIGYDSTVRYLAKKVKAERDNPQSPWVKILDDPRWKDVKAAVGQVVLGEMTKEEVPLHFVPSEVVPVEPFMAPWPGPILVDSKDNVAAEQYKPAAPIRGLEKYFREHGSLFMDILAWLMRRLGWVDLLWQVARKAVHVLNDISGPAYSVPGRQETSSAVRSEAAVVAVSSSPLGSPLEQDWYRFYTNKLSPLTPHHEEYMMRFVGNFMDPDKTDWQEFRQQVEADPGSPWQVVLTKVQEAEGRGAVAEGFGDDQSLIMRGVYAYSTPQSDDTDPAWIKFWESKAGRR